MLDNMKKVQTNLTAIWWGCQEVVQESTPSVLDKYLLNKSERFSKYRTKVLYEDIRKDVELAQKHVNECYPLKAKKQLEKLQTRFNNMVGVRPLIETLPLDDKLPMMVKIGGMLTESIGLLRRQGRSKTPTP